MDKLEEVHANFSSLTKIGNELDSILLFFQPIRATWFPKGKKLKEILLASSQYKGSEVKEFEITWKNYNQLIKKLPIIEKEKKAMSDRFESLMGL